MINSKLFFIAILIGCLFFLGCSSDKKPSSNIDLPILTLNKNLTINPNDTKALVNDFNGLVVDKQDKIYTADEKLQMIHIFSPQGQYLDSLGRKGKGPGEFIHLNSNIRIQSDTLYVMQNTARQVDLFNIKTNKFIRSIKIPKININNAPIGQPRNLFPLPNGNILVSFGRPYFRAPESNKKPYSITISLLSPSGKFLRNSILQLPEPYPYDQTLVSMQSNGISVWKNLSFYPYFNIETGPKDQLYVGLSDSLIIRKYNQRGKMVYKLQSSNKPSPFTGANLDSVARKKDRPFINAVKKAGVPSYWPVFQDFIIDDKDRCWVELYDPGNSKQKWLVFDSDGQPRWKFSLSGYVQLYSIQQDIAYGISNPKNTFPKIVRYHIDGM